MNLVRSALILALATASLSSHAVIAFSSFGVNQSYDHNAAYAVQYPVGGFAFQFTSGATGELAGFDLAIAPVEEPFYAHDPTPKPFTLTLLSERPHQTASVLGSFDGLSAPGRAHQSASDVVHVEASGVTLTKGASYWLWASMTPDGSHNYLGWNQSSVVLSSPVGIYDAGGFINGPTMREAAAFSVLVAPVPEPASLCALGLGAVAMFRRRIVRK